MFIVAYYWPPAGGPGVQRWLKFLKYLPEFDYDVTLFVPDNPDYPTLDFSLMDEIPKGLKVVRVPIFEPSRVMGALLRKRTKNLQKGIIPQKKGILQRAVLWVRGNLFIPDSRKFWAGRVFKEMKLHLTDQENITLITTGPPHSVHLVGLKMIKAYTSVKWITDFRDPWTTISYHKHLELSHAAARRHKNLEHKVLNSAHRIIVTSKNTKREFTPITKTPIDIITNGFDVPVMSNLAQPIGKFTLSHIGTFLRDRNPEVLWEVLVELIEEIPEFKARFILQLAGNVSPKVLHSLKEYHLGTYVNNMGYLKHKKAFDLMKNSQALLLIEIDSEETKSIIPGKLFEYLASRRPIIAVGPAGADIGEVIKETQSGKFFNHQQKAELKHHIIDLFVKYIRKDNDAVISSNISKFHRKQLTKHLSRSIKKVWE